MPDNVLKPLIKTVYEDSYFGATERDPVLITDRFMRGMGTKG